MEAQETYVDNDVSTQERAKLVAMLYDGAIKFLRTAKQKLQEGDYALKGVYIGKAQDIVAELNNCLNVQAGPQIANDLRALYNFLYGHLTQANIERSPEMIDESIKVLAELRQAWEQAAANGGDQPDSARQTGFSYQA